MMTGKFSYRVLPRETMYMENDLLPTNASNFQNRSSFTEEATLVKEEKIHSLFSPAASSSYLTPKLQLQSQLQKDTQVHSFKEIPFLKVSLSIFLQACIFKCPEKVDGGGHQICWNRPW